MRLKDLANIYRTRPCREERAGDPFRSSESRIAHTRCRIGRLIYALEYSPDFVQKLCMGRTFIPNKSSAADSPAARFLRSARLCRNRDLEQVSILGELMRELSQLIHALQKERGASSIYLGSNGLQFLQRLFDCIAECEALEITVRDRLEHIDGKLDRMSCGARFFTRVALAFRALDTLPELREQISSLTMVPQDSVKAFTDIIGTLLAVGFEVGDIAADPEVSRALVALVNFSQAKEYAGQERATAGAALSSGHIHAADRQRLKQLVDAQEQAFTIFSEFADRASVDALQEVLNSIDAAKVARMRVLAAARQPGEPPGVPADEWYQHTTRRIDGLKVLEDELASALGRLCGAKLEEAHKERAAGALSEPFQDAIPTAPVAMVLADSDPVVDHIGLDRGVGLYCLEAVVPKPMRSILNVLRAQARRIDDVSAQLESARAALAERKVIERAKGLLMSSRRISEKEAYALIRETAMNQNKRVVEIAENIVSMAEMLKAP
jgi:Nitrate and nitrite sensing/ANTAR domain